MEELLAIMKQQAATIDSLSSELALLRESVAQLTHKLYGNIPRNPPIHLVNSVFLRKERFLKKGMTDLVETGAITYKRQNRSSK